MFSGNHRTPSLVWNTDCRSELKDHILLHLDGDGHLSALSLQSLVFSFKHLSTFLLIGGVYVDVMLEQPESIVPDAEKVAISLIDYIRNEVDISVFDPPRENDPAEVWFQKSKLLG